MIKPELTLKAVTENARIGLRLRQLRKNKGISMQWVADKLGITESMLSLMETGRRKWPDGMPGKFLVAIGEDAEL